MIPPIADVPERARLLFLHIPKTAGTTMREFLAAHYRASDILPASTWNQVAAKKPDLAAYRLYSGHFGSNFRQGLPADTLMMTVLREPLQRWMSHVLHAKVDPVFNDEFPRLKAFPIAQILRTPDLVEDLANFQTRWLARVADFASVTAFLRANPKARPYRIEAACDVATLLARAKAFLGETDFVGTTDHIELLVADLSESLGFHPIAPLPVRNKARLARSSHPLSESDWELVREQNAADLELYAFVRDLALRKSRQRSVMRMLRSGQLRVFEFPFQLDVANPIPGSGWYLPEFEGEKAWRWTDGGVATTLQIVARFPSDACCRIRFLWTVTSPPAIEAWVNGEPQVVDIATAGDFTDLIVPLGKGMPCEGNARYVDLAFRIARDANPVAAGPDPRNLGIPVVGIEFIPLSTAKSHG